jgi:hypothetical protein
MRRRSSARVGPRRGFAAAGDRQLPVTAHPNAPLVRDEQVAGRELAHARVERPRRRHVQKLQVVGERRAIQLAGSFEGAQLGGEGQTVSRRRVEEGLLPEAIPRADQRPGARVPEREGKHPAQAGDEVFAVVLVEVEQHLDVRLGAEGVAVLQLFAQLAVVVDLPVGDDADGAVLVEHRLRAAGEVDDRQAAVAEGDRAIGVEAFAVGAAVGERVGHAADGFQICGGKSKLTRDAAHGAALFRSPCGKSRSRIEGRRAGSWRPPSRHAVSRTSVPRATNVAPRRDAPVG